MMPTMGRQGSSLCHPPAPAETFPMAQETDSIRIRRDGQTIYEGAVGPALDRVREGLLGAGDEIDRGADQWRPIVADAEFAAVLSAVSSVGRPSVPQAGPKPEGNSIIFWAFLAWSLVAVVLAVIQFGRGRYSDMLLLLLSLVFCAVQILRLGRSSAVGRALQKAEDEPHKEAVQQEEPVSRGEGRD